MPFCSTRHVRRAALVLPFALAACHGGSSYAPSALPGSAPIAASQVTHRIAPTSGVNVAALHGWATRQLSAENDRLHLRIGPALANAGAVGGLRRVQSLSQSVIVGSGSTSALVLYDTAGAWGYLGELYAMATANLAGHFGSVSAEPISSYTSGQINSFTATIYLGSTYYDTTNDAIPAAFYTDVAASTHPVVWVNDNIWNFANAIGISAFENTYGWDPTTSYFAPNGSIGNVTQVTYKGEPLTRTIPAGDDGGVLHPNVLGGAFPAVTTLASALDSSTATTFPWAIRSGNLTYVGEIPFDYVNESDRVIAFEDLLFDALAPTTATRHRAMVRLEDLNAKDSPTQLMTVAQFLYNQKISYGFNVIPLYKDPLGAYNNGVAQTITLGQAPQFLNAIHYMLTHGGTIVDEGYTHQYNATINPYTGASGDDAEFFRVHVDSGNNIVWDGPVAEDSSTWAAGRAASAALALATVGLAKPTLWVTPHYFATDVDYRAFSKLYPTRYERSLYFSGVLAGGAVNHALYIGEFFPYVVHDVYGTKVLPENLGDYEPVALNNHPVRLPADIINEAKLNLAVRDGFASFFYDPTYGTAPLQQTINGIKALGYTFTAPSASL